MDTPKKGSIFTLGPAPPGHRPPNTSLFKRLEYNLMAMSRHIRGTTAKIDLLRSAHRIEISTAMRKSIKEQIMLSIRDQILARKVMAKNSLELKALQDAEILKVVRHLHEIDKNRQEWSHNLARLKVDLKQESDPDKVRCLQKEIYALIKDLKKSKDLRERWRLRMVQMEAAKIKVLQPPTNNQSVDESDMSKMPRKRRPNIGLRTRHAVQQKKYSQNLSEERKNMRKEYDRLRRSKPYSPSKISTLKPKTKTKPVKVVTEKIKKNISSAKSTTEKEAPNVVENINKNISSPKPNTNTICLSKTVALISKENIDKRIKPTKDCKRCAFLQRSNKNNKDVPRVCNICLKWAHKVLQDGVEITPVRNVPINNTTASELAMAALKEHDYADSESTIKVEIEPVTEEEESLEEMDSPMPSVHVEIESLDDSMNDEIMSDIIKEEETETLSTTESIDFDKVTLIQDGLKSIDDKTTALAHVRILQEYAMLNDNYRAIGLLSEVEAALINPAKNEDFEC